MRGLALVLVVLFAGLAGRAQGDDMLVLELRAVAEAGPGRVTIDRGTLDGLVVGDLVTFLPREGPPVRGSLREISARSGTVELFDPAARVAPGTRGEARVPSARLPEAEPQAQPVAGETAGEPEPVGPPAEGEPGAQGWKPGMPLLAEVGVVRPSERETSMTGRIYSSGDQTFTNDDGRSSGFYRAGTVTEIQNAFGRGDVLRLDTELISFYADNPDADDADSLHLRVDTASYREGGTRFEPRFLQIGRFFQSGMPEFGQLDGVEVAQRLPGGDRWGASVGFSPEPDDGQETGQDMQFAGWYRWVSDTTEQLTATAGYQKSFHNSSSDRDLLVARVDWLPPRGWNFLGTAWIDFYNGGDQEKDSRAEVTLARLSTAKRWDDGSRVDIALFHQRYAELERDELPPFVDPTLYDDHYTRLTYRGETPWGSTRAHTTVGGWIDQDDVGGDVAGGLEWSDVFRERDTFDTTLFASLGKFNDEAGTRFMWARLDDRGSWNVFYELAFQRIHDFSSDRDDILQHWLGASRNLTSVMGWNLSLSAQTRLWDDFNSWNLGFYLQRNF
ncbi:MAG TPA: hypothetical protein VMT18_14420 [Planctomycetota bacterium]|nr:hypothetical protein [Planctomycetota bacterium]